MGMTRISTKLIKDGNSKAVRLSKTVLEMSGLEGAIVLNVKKGEIVITNDKNPRKGWAEAVESDAVGVVDTDLEDWDALIMDGLDD